MSNFMPGATYLLYVEDEITRRYLNVLIPSQKIVDVRVVGGCQRVLGCLENDFRIGMKHSRGLVDRDFDRNAKSGWQQTGNGVPYYCLPAHEIENYLLDFGVIAQFAAKYIITDADSPKDAGHWRAIARSIAEGYLYSVAYNQVLADVQREYQKGYPHHIKLMTGPGRNLGVTLSGEQIKTESDLLDKLEKDTWISSAVARATTLLGHDSLKQKATEAIAHYQSPLDGTESDWVRGFPGKEMFRAIANSMSLTDEKWLDMAHFIAAEQKAGSSIPQDIQDLLSKLS